MLREGARVLEWLPLEMQGRGEARKTKERDWKCQVTKGLEVHDQKFDFHSDVSCLGHHGAVRLVHFSPLIIQIWHSSV